MHTDSLTHSLTHSPHDEPFPPESRAREELSPSLPGLAPGSAEHRQHDEFEDREHVAQQQVCGQEAMAWVR